MAVFFSIILTLSSHPWKQEAQLLQKAARRSSLSYFEVYYVKQPRKLSNCHTVSTHFPSTFVFSCFKQNEILNDFEQTFNIRLLEDLTSDDAWRPARIWGMYSALRMSMDWVIGVRLIDTWSGMNRTTQLQRIAQGWVRSALRSLHRSGIA